MSKYEMRCLPLAEFRMEDGEDNSIRLVGHAAVFNSFSEDLGGFREIIRPDAFTRTLASNPDVRFLINHDGLPLARTKSKTLQLTADQRGLHFVASLDKADPDCQRLLPKMKRGDLNQMSFGFRCLRDNWRVEDGKDIRELHDCELDDGDVSVVSYPAYKAADVSMRNLTEVKAAHQEFRKRLDDAAKADEAKKLAARGYPVALALRMVEL